MTISAKCAHCGAELNADGTKHYNDILFCAFVTPDIDWYDWRTAKKPDLNDSPGGGADD